MKTKSFFVICLFALTAFQPAPKQETTTITKAVVTEYCGYISASCDGTMSIKIGFSGSGPYVVALYKNGVSIPFQVNSITQSPFQDNIFELDMYFQCFGSNYHYVGNAYCSEC